MLRLEPELLSAKTEVNFSLQVTQTETEEDAIFRPELIIDFP